MNKLITSAIVALFALSLSTAYLLDGPDDIAAAQAQALSLNDAMQTAATEAYNTRAAAQLCGDNAAFKSVDATTVQCYTHAGKPTRRVSL